MATSRDSWEGGGKVALDIMHDHSYMTTGPRIPKTSGRTRRDVTHKGRHAKRGGGVGGKLPKGWEYCLFYGPPAMSEHRSLLGAVRQNMMLS